jgi:hypothetical protein
MRKGFEGLYGLPVTGCCANHSAGMCSSSPTRNAASHLKTAGEALFVCQFRNSYFKQMPSLQGARRHLNGWAVLRTGDRSSYYGILPKGRLEDLIKQYGFAVRQSWLAGQSAYVQGVPK